LWGSGETWPFEMLKREREIEREREREREREYPIKQTNKP
jgi:hypothetical protein